MCGFFGYQNLSQLNKYQINYIESLLKHRGPDSTKFIFDDVSNFNILFCRLSIQDISEKAMQPFYDDSKYIYILFNGEIYNFKFLKKELESLGCIFKSNSDTEVLLNGYKLWGLEKLIDKIQGMYAFSIIDNRLGKIFLVRDPFGIKPLYYSNSNNFTFASEIKPILFIKEKNDWCHKGSIPSLFNGVCQNDDTPYADIKELEAGNFAVFDTKSKTLRIKKYFNPRDLVDPEYYQEINKKKPTELINYFNDILCESVDTHMISDVPLASCFSAGLDSSIISALAANQSSKKINLFCYLSDGDKQIIKNCAKDFTKIFNSQIHYVDEKNNDDLLKSIVNNLYYNEIPNKIEGFVLSKLCQTASLKGFKVMLTGDAADELLGGYHYYKQFYNRSLSSISPLNYLIKIINRIQPLNLFELTNENPIATDYFFKPSHLDLYSLPYDLLINKDDRLSEWNKNINAYKFIKNKVHANTQSFLLDGLNTKLKKYLHRSDRYGMSASIELRIPFLNKVFVKAILNLNLKNKLNLSFLNRQITDKYILRSIGKLNNIPKKILKRKKMGTNINYKKKLIDLCNKINFEHSSSILKIDKKKIKSNLLQSKSSNREFYQYNFFSTEILGKMFIENKNYEEVIEDIRKL